MPLELPGRTTGSPVDDAPGAGGPIGELAGRSRCRSTPSARPDRARRRPTAVEPAEPEAPAPAADPT